MEDQIYDATMFMMFWATTIALVFASSLIDILSLFVLLIVVVFIFMDHKKRHIKRIERILDEKTEELKRQIMQEEGSDKFNEFMEVIRKDQEFAEQIRSQSEDK